MDILVSAIVGDLISRSASFVISKYFQQQPDINKIVERLQSVVLRIDIIIEEAEARHITNQGMLRQLKMLRQGMYRGHYVLDALRFQAALREEEREEEMSHSSSALSKYSPIKRLRFSCTGSGSSNREALLFGTNSNIREELQRMVDTLEYTVAGMKEFLFFLELYPRILRQPYGTYLLLDNCMFGRQTERKQVLDFLLRPSATPDLAVLPIIGPIRVGKSTLVEHVCRDESVRDHFSMILFFPQGSLKDEGVVDLLLFDQHPNLRVREDEPVYSWTLEKRRRYFLICNHHQSYSSENIPKIGVQDILLGRGDMLPHGEFEALTWRSRIPPYYNYTISCKLQAPQFTVGRKRRVHQEEQHFI